MAIKTCISCGQPFDTTFVVEGKKRWMGRRIRCLECFPFGASRAEPIELKREKNRAKQRAWISRKRKEEGQSPYKLAASQKKQVVVGLLGGGCQLCGYSRCLRSLTFHHLRNKSHGLTLREFQKSWGRLIPELRKCVLLCQNCHAEVHEGLVKAHQLVQLNETLSGALDALENDLVGS